ncbi:MAG: hypothetical protein H6598_08335 [Flavobacteriales bacterium]|nr:hypothetical protein [Flavobacteriales bacterium]
MNITEYHELDGQAVYLLMINVENIPPHLGLIYKGRYFSKSSLGGKFDQDAQLTLKSLIRKKIPSILVRLNMNIVDPKAFFNKIPLRSGESCLSPIKNLISENFSEVSSSKYVFDILEVLIASNKLSTVEHICCDKLISEGHITLNKYDQEDIDKAILNTKMLC